MTHDYDWVVIGDSPEAQFAAERAGRLRARVAWVNQVAPGERPVSPQLRAEVMLGYLKHVMDGLPLLGGMPEKQLDKLDIQALWQQARSRAEMVVAEREYSALAQVGVDVVAGQGRFGTKPGLHLWVDPEGGGGRELRSRHYLLAPEARPRGMSPRTSSSDPPLALAGSVNPGEAEKAAQDWTTWPTLPQQLVLLGADPQGLVLAQTMARLGCCVTVIAAQTALLPSFDPELAVLATAVLQASGVELRLDAGSPAACWTLGQSLAESNAEASLLSWEDWRPHWPGLNLEALGLSPDTAAGVNGNQRTQHWQIWGCGAAVAHGPGRDALAQHQALVALRNGLWWPGWSTQESAVLKTLPLSPPFVQVGLTEPQAQRWYGKKVTVVRQYAQDCPATQHRDQTVGLCKLVVHSSGKLLGAQALAAGAEDWMAAAAMVIQRGGSVKDLNRVTLPRDRQGSLLDQAAAQWRWDCLAKTPRREDLIERFFNWRRTGSV